MRQAAMLKRPHGKNGGQALVNSQWGTEAFSPVAHEELNLAKNH